jgi:DNA repair protein SbcD/Mre11
MGFKILHFADLHLDTPFTNSNLPSRFGIQRRLDLQATLTRILTTARQKKVDAITIGGDLFDQDYSLPRTAEFLSNQFSKVAPIRVYVAPGEHDPYTNDSLYSQANWSENVDIFYQGKLTSRDLSEKIKLWGASYPPARGYRMFEETRLSPDCTNLLLLHAVEKGNGQQEGQGMYVLDEAAIKTSGFKLTLLGHRHTSKIWPMDSPIFAYPGSPEPLGLEEEAGEHTVILTNIEDGNVSIETVSIRQWSYRSETVDLTGCESAEQVETLIKEALDKRDTTHTATQVVLAGIVDFEFDIRGLLDQFTSQAFCYFDYQLKMKYDLVQLAQERTVRGLLVNRYIHQLSATKGDEHRKLLTALNFALQALESV